MWVIFSYAFWFLCVFDEMPVKFIDPFFSQDNYFLKIGFKSVSRNHVF